MTEVEVYIVVDAEGNYEIGMEKEEAIQRYEDNHGALNECDGFRIVRSVVKVPKPEIIEVESECEEVA